MGERTYPSRTGRMMTGATAIILSVGYTVQASGLRFGSLEEPGPALFPMIVGPLLGIAGLTVLMEARRMEKTEGFQFPTGVDLRRLLSLLGLLLGYVIFLPILGHLIASAFMVFGVMRVISDESWLKLLVYAVVLSGGIYLFFAEVLHVLLPRGILINLL